MAFLYSKFQEHADSLEEKIKAYEIVISDWQDATDRANMHLRLADLKAMHKRALERIEKLIAYYESGR